MTALDISTRTATVNSQGVAIPAYLAEPVGGGPYAGIIVLQEIFGVNCHIRDVTERLARLGYVAIAPAIFHRQAPGFESGYTEADLIQGREYKAGTRVTELLSDVQGAIDYLQNMTSVQGEKIGCIGFCFGGHVAYLAATLPAIKATASFYGAGITTMTPGGGAPTITRTADIQGVLYGFFGMADASIPPATVDDIEAALQQHQIPHAIFRYPDADHGFFCDQRASYQPTAAAAAWEEVQRLFRQTLA